MGSFAHFWEDGGYELYEGVTTEWVEKGIREDIGAPVRRRLDLREVLDGLMAKYYALEADVKAMAPHDADRVMTWWIGKLAGATGAIGDTGLAQFIEEVGWEGSVVGGTHETAWEAALRELAQYTASDEDYSDSE
jgi:hypothetical protein